MVDEPAAEFPLTVAEAAADDVLALDFVAAEVEEDTAEEDELFELRRFVSFTESGLLLVKPLVELESLMLV